MQQLRILGRLLMGQPPGPDVDWGPIAVLAVRNHVAPLLSLQLRRLNDSVPDAAQEEPPVPEAILTQLQRIRRGAVLHGMMAERELADVLEALAGAGVPALVVKGAAVAAFYPHAALRPYGDLDLLVRKEQLTTAREALRPLGYHGATAGEWTLQRHPHLPHLDSDGKRLAVELHWRLDSAHAGGYLPVDEVWQRAVSWSVGGQPAMRLEDVDAVLHLCSHALLRHRGNLGLRPICDVAQVSMQWDRQRWQTLAARASVYGLGHIVYLMLSLLEDLMGQEVPQEVMVALRPTLLEASPREMIAPMVRSDGDLATGMPPALVRILTRGSPRDRIRRFFWHLFLPRAAMETVYGVPAKSPRIVLAYLWRPIDLLARYSGSLVATIRRDSKARAIWVQQAGLEQWLWQEETDSDPGQNAGALR